MSRAFAAIPARILPFPPLEEVGLHIEAQGLGLAGMEFDEAEQIPVELPLQGAAGAAQLALGAVLRPRGEWVDLPDSSP